MRPNQQSEQTNIDFSLTFKYLLMGIVVAIILFMVALIVIEAIDPIADSMKRITSYSLAIIMGGGMLFGISNLFDPNRKEKERDELFASIREAMKQQREMK